MLFTRDVESLYTNTAGLATVKQAFSNVDDPDRSDKDSLELLDVSLKYDDFQFNSEFYLQIHGTTFTSNYANISVAEWEKQALRKCTKLPLIYLRYLDDIFGMGSHGDAEFQIFLDTLNNHQRF